ncbi:hypothetical protein BS78_03G155500 [Paspalum vaginatum]|nr:hypothetical protein BS78_03G155500 [Paspalum vaginatum]
MPQKNGTQSEIKIVETNCDIICLQETKKAKIVHLFIRNICPVTFNKFEFVPSMGASGGMLVAWKGNLFDGELVFPNNFAMSLEFTSLVNDASWRLTNIYAPCTADGKRGFLDWFENIHMPLDLEWIILGDFNLIRKPQDRNKPGGDVNDMMAFKQAISSPGLIELPLTGKQFTWSNKQDDPLLERLDWFFTNNAWTLAYPNTRVETLVMEASDHCPC